MEGYPKVSDNLSFEQMTPKYTYALGGTDKLKELLDFLNSQESVTKTILAKYETKESYKI